LRIETGRSTETAIFFNRALVLTTRLEPGVSEFSLEIKRLPVQPQFNYVNLKSDTEVTLKRVDFPTD
jgi:hypothetical protein